MRARESTFDARCMLAVGLAYLLAAGVTIAWTRFDGGIAQLWIATPLLVAQLMRTETRQWWRVMLPCAVANIAATAVLGLGPAAALPMSLANMTEALIGAGLMRAMGKGDDYLSTLGNVCLFVLCAGLAAPLLTAAPGALVASWATAKPFSQLIRDWLMSHALGMLVFAPPITMFLRSELSEWARSMSAKRRFEALGLFGVMIATCVVTFGQDKVPLLFLPMLPLIIITFRLDRVGAAMAVVILVACGTAFTAYGHGPLNLVHVGASRRNLFLQFYFAVSVLTVLPAAAELRQRRDIFRRLVHSEARYRLLTEHASDIVLETDANGIVRYVSPSAVEVTGFAPERLVGLTMMELPCGPDKRSFIAAIRAVREQAGASTAIEYRATDSSGALKWFEARTRGIFDEAGVLTGAVSLVRDISHRKTLEMRLARAATTDPLTGLGNRRAFDMLLDQRLEECRIAGTKGCVAIFDLDHFKQVNDRFGHDVGDRVLESFAATALGVVRGHDYVARLGGEEFGIILDGVDVMQARQICERLRDTLGRQNMRAGPGQSVSVTASAGIAAIRNDRSRDQIMKAADEALYSAKGAGRDRLAIAA